VANDIKHQAAVAAGHAGQALPAGRSGGAVPAVMLHHALAVGISRGFLIAAGIAVLAFPVVMITIRIHRSDLTGAIAAPTPASEVDGRSIDPEFPEATI
jgi:hypothetical protein